LFLGTIVIKYKNYCKREYNLSPLLGFSNSDITNSSNSSVISNSPLLLLVFSDPSITNSSDFSIINSSPSLRYCINIIADIDKWRWLVMYYI
jgi:hypothetical protein